MNVDIFVSDHTHQNEVVLEDGHYFINPESFTGDYASLTPEPIPSFILLAVQDSKLVCYVYKGGEVEVSKTEFTEASPPTAEGTTTPSNNNQSWMQSGLACEK
jgi:vacuolar protein sorting-associated protein 29